MYMEVSVGLFGGLDALLFNQFDRFLNPGVDLDAFLPAADSRRRRRHRPLGTLNRRFQRVSMILLASRGDSKRFQCICKRMH